MYDFHRHQSRSQVQLAALRATVELLDGVAEGEARAWGLIQPITIDSTHSGCIFQGFMI